MAERKFRHELKYVASGAQVRMLQNRMEHLLERDRHAGEAGEYSVRSLYFDDYANRCYYENENGTDPREKFRLRIYNHSAERIRLECKRKERGMTQKTACLLTQEQARQLIMGKTLGDAGSQEPVMQKLTVEMLTRRMQPKVIVEYRRIPYVYKNGNVRITLDLNVASCSSVQTFLEEEIAVRPVMPAGRQLLEVKYDEFLPDFIYRNLQLESLQQTAFSKYFLCRKYTR